MKPTISVEAAAKRLGVGVETLKQMLIQGKVPYGEAVNLGKSWRFIVVERRLEAYLNAEDLILKERI